jgi:undecaprenyl-diphosphatase
MNHGEEPPSASTLRQLAPKLDIEGDLRTLWDAWAQLLGGLACAVSLLILFAWLAEEVFEGELQYFDLRVRTLVHAYSNPQLTRIMQTLTFLGSIGFLSVLFAILISVFLARGLKRPAIWLAVAVGGSVVLDISLKLSFQRARPVPFFGPAPVTYSFPSGHALSSLCFYGVLAGLYCARMQSRVARILAWFVTGALVAGVGFSRIYLGVHYPTDVIAGYLAGAIWVSTLLFAARLRRRAPSTP